MKKLLTISITICLTLAFSLTAFAAASMPATGGIGTKIFYIAGGSLAVVAAILLIVKKIMS